ncbi:LysM peptidoglycan-binding domain-containing protein [Mycobacterium sp. E2479]|uniref:LysM peptidoglycan-binding domain-containing protein n=1 Tax=Mycobacterium sp. E2479 TaxID=1834134 RepID=UPI00080141B6|nr:LysM peptidoglycan-binding domain-containing protein [Mycobacterium sp. E2479]OBH55493.1 hypothetical protein A5686_06540 [Mycobacterium sp. E2479]
MTVIHPPAPHTSSLRRPINGPVQGARYGRDGLARTRRPTPTRPTNAATRYGGTGVAMSVARHGRRATTWASTIGLALAAGAITLWLGLVANVGQVLNGDSTNSAAHVPDRLAIVRVDAGESLQDFAHRVAPDAPTTQVADRIRELNDLHSSNLMAGQTLIAPVG